MSRIVEGEATKGSRAWLQRFVESRPDLLQPAGLGRLNWLSPRREDGWAEYSDETALSRLGLARLAPDLSAFWPKRGPVWDGLAVRGDLVVLVEAKAHVAEFLTSPSSARSPGSVAMIRDSLGRAKRGLGGDDRSDWTRTFYQYANRLTYVWWLRESGVDAKLLFVSFLGDREMAGPASADVWKAVFQTTEYALGLPSRHSLSAHVLHVFPDVSEIECR